MIITRIWVERKINLAEESFKITEQYFLRTYLLFISEVKERSYPFGPILSNWRVGTAEMMFIHPCDREDDKATR